MKVVFFSIVIGIIIGYLMGFFVGRYGYGLRCPKDVLCIKPVGGTKDWRTFYEN